MIRPAPHLLTIAALAACRGESRDREAPPAAPGHATAGPAWPGEIDTREIELPVPDGYVRADECSTATESWHLPGLTVGRLAAFARGHRLDAASTSLFAGLARCDDAGCSVTPTPALVESLDRDERSALYRELRRHPENRLQVFAYLRPLERGAWSDMPGLSPHVRELLVRGLWATRTHYAFSDLPWLCQSLRSDAERVEALRALRVRYGVDARLRVPASGDLEPLVRYWSPGSDPATVRRVLEGARARGSSVPVALLLPPMARVRLNRFPNPSDPDYDCFWSAARFFEGESPSDRMPGPQGIAQLVRDRYVEVPPSEARLGDLVTFVEPDGSLAHAATQVAGDLLFTKNGRSHQRPWVLMRLADVHAGYPHVAHVRWHRRRGR